MKQMTTALGTLSRLVSKSGKRTLSISNIPKPPLFTRVSPAARRHLSSSTCVWNPPPKRVDNFLHLVTEAKRALQSPDLPGGDGRHWLVILDIDVEYFATHQDLLDFYVNTLARVLGSEEEARKKIYLVSCELCFGFGAEIDQATKYKLLGDKDVTFVLEDYYYGTKKRDLRVCSDPQSKMVDRKHQLLDMYSYHYLSDPIPNCKPNYWLVHVTPPDSGFDSERETIEFCYQLLAEVVGSKEQAKQKIYIVWCKIPFGFAAEIDEKILKKLKGRPDVVKVLPDHAFDVNKKNHDVLVISPPSKLELDSIQTFCYAPFSDIFYYEDSGYYSDYHREDEVSDHLMKKSVDESPVCQHWFAVVEKPGGEIGSWQEMISSYIKTLAAVIGSVEAAKEKIYRVKCEDDFFGFGAEIDKASSDKLKGLPGVRDVFPDYLLCKDHKGVDFSDGKALRNTLEEMKMDFRGWAIQTLVTGSFSKGCRSRSGSSSPRSGGESFLDPRSTNFGSSNSSFRYTLPHFKS